MVCYAFEIAGGETMVTTTSRPTTKPTTTVKPTSHPVGIDSQPTRPPAPIQRPPDVVLPPAEQGTNFRLS